MGSRKPGKSPGGYPWSDERASQPLTLSLSLWERERLLSGHSLPPLPWGEGWGEG
jgi:hypothetical protein